MKHLIKVIGAFALAFCLMGADGGCDDNSSDSVQRRQQETLLKEGTSQVGMPAIKNFRERKLLKDILELRDQEGLVTYSYIWSEMQAKWVFLCDSIGYGIPYATEFTNPQKLTYADHGPTLPQADPNGLFAPSSAEGTWVMCKNPAGPEVRPIYVEPRLIVSPFKLEAPTAVAPSLAPHKP